MLPAGKTPEQVQMEAGLAELGITEHVVLYPCMLHINVCVCMNRAPYEALVSYMQNGTNYIYKQRFAQL